MDKVKEKKKECIEAITVYSYCVPMKEPVPETGTWMIVFEKVSVNVGGMGGGGAGCFPVHTDQDSPTIGGCK